MPILTLEAIRQNPWNVLIYELPEHPPQLLLALSQIAATYCRQIEAEMFAATEHSAGTTLDFDWRESSDRFIKANRKIGEICGLLEAKFGVPAHDFWLSRNST